MDPGGDILARVLCAIFKGRLAAVLIALLNRIVRSNRAILWMASVLLSFLFGMAIYIPIQFFLILAAAI